MLPILLAIVAAAALAPTWTPCQRAAASPMPPSWLDDWPLEKLGPLKIYDQDWTAPRNVTNGPSGPAKSTGQLRATLDCFKERHNAAVGWTLSGVAILEDLVQAECATSDRLSVTVGADMLLVQGFGGHVETECVAVQPEPEKSEVDAAIDAFAGWISRVPPQCMRRLVIDLEPVAATPDKTVGPALDQNQLTRVAKLAASSPAARRLAIHAASNVAQHELTIEVLEDALARPNSPTTALWIADFSAKSFAAETALQLLKRLAASGSPWSSVAQLTVQAPLGNHWLESHTDGGLANELWLSLERLARRTPALRHLQIYSAACTLPSERLWTALAPSLSPRTATVECSYHDLTLAVAPAATLTPALSANPAALAVVLNVDRLPFGITYYADDRFCDAWLQSHSAVWRSMVALTVSSSADKTLAGAVVRSVVAQEHLERLFLRGPASVWLDHAHIFDAVVRYLPRLPRQLRQLAVSGLVATFPRLAGLAFLLSGAKLDAISLHIVFVNARADVFVAARDAILAAGRSMADPRRFKLYLQLVKPHETNDITALATLHAQILARLPQTRVFLSAPRQAVIINSPFDTWASRHYRVSQLSPSYPSLVTFSDDPEILPL